MKNSLDPEAQEAIEDQARQDLAWLIENTRPERWSTIAQLLRLLREQGGYGRLILPVSDGMIGPHPKIEISL